MPSAPKPAQSEEAVDLAIAGGGLVGATLALAAARNGLSVAVIDQGHPGDYLNAAYDGRSSAIAYSSHRMFRILDVWDDMLSDAGEIRDIRITDGASPLYLHYDHRDVRDEPLGWIVENQAIRRALLGATLNHPRIRWHHGTSVTSWQAEPAGVSVSTADDRQIPASLLVAADGRNSRLRTLARIRTSEWTYRQTGIVCTAVHEHPHDNVAHERFLPGGPFAILPLPDRDGRHRSSIVWTERSDMAAAIMQLDQAGFEAELRTRFGDFMGRVTTEGGRWSWPLGVVHAEKYVAPRFVLAGDAAHGIHPIAGQGFNMGLRDVAALAEELVNARRVGLDIGGADVLARYQRWRHFDNTAMLGVTDLLNRLFSNDIPPVRLARGLGLAAVNRLPGLKRLFMHHAMGTTGELPRLLAGEPI
ncbi:MAG: UbiH/UbiF/VisC/COQ6 family ubiquinone biosynthesis hydroxylase [Rhodospirillales bacterium]